MKSDGFFESPWWRLPQKLFESGFDEIVNAEEAEAAREKFGDGKIVEGVERNRKIWIAFVELKPLERTEGGGVGLVESEFAFARTSDGPRTLGLIGIMQGVGNKKFHVVLRDVHFGGAGFGVDHAMDNALRVNGDVDVFEVDVEEIVDFVNFENFVDERGGVDADFWAHFPGGMGEGFGWRDVGEFGGGAAAERAAATSEGDGLDLVGAVLVGELPDGGSFGVEREDFGAGFCGFGAEIAAGNGEGFFVRGEQSFPGAHSGQRNGEPIEAGYGVDDIVRLLNQVLDLRVDRCEDGPLEGLHVQTFCSVF